MKVRYVVRPTDDRDCEDPRINWDVCDKLRPDGSGQPTAISTHTTRKAARARARELEGGAS